MSHDSGSPSERPSDQWTEHTTHHDDCGCLSARYEAELAAARGDLQAEFDGNAVLRREGGARDDETMFAFVRRLRAEVERLKKQIDVDEWVAVEDVAGLRAEVEAMRKVVEAAVAFRDPDRDPDAEPLMLNLWTAVDAYLAGRKGAALYGTPEEGK